jgi:hypothetical protein
MAGLVAQPQSPRAGLVAAIVISLVLNGLLAVGYFKQSNESFKLRGEVAEVTKKCAEAVTEQAMETAEYNNLKE